MNTEAVKPDATSYSEAVESFSKASLGVLFALVVGAWPASLLQAAVIDDFESQAPKWLCGSEGCENLLFSQTSGQFIVAGQFPPSGDRIDQVYWPDSMPVGDLHGRTLVLQMDIVSLSGEDHLLLVGASMEGGGYWVGRSQDQIAVVKVIAGGPDTAFFLEDAPVKYTNTTVVLELAPVGDSLWVTARLLDKDDSNAVIYERSFLDGPGSDVGVLTNLPPTGFPFQADPGGPLTMNVDLAWAAVVFIGAGTPPPAELVLDNLEYELYDPPHLAIEKMADGKSARVSWSENTAPEHILLSAETVDGPWEVCPEPIVGGGSGRLEVTARTANHSQYFKLAQAEWFTDEFTEGMNQGWETLYGGQPT